MRLRKRFSEEVNARCAATLPAVLATAWGDKPPVTVIESLTLTSTGGEIDQDGLIWKLLTDFEGVILIQLNADDIDSLEIEPLLANLIQEPIYLKPDPDLAVGDLSEKCASKLMTIRDTVNETSVVSQLRFSVSGYVVERVAREIRPALLISEAPEIGAAHELSYVPLDESFEI